MSPAENPAERRNIEELQDTYRAAVTTAVLAARMLALHDFDAMIASIDHAHNIGPLVDPTLYRDRAQAMSEDRQVLVAARELVRVFRRATDPANHPQARGG